MWKTSLQLLNIEVSLIHATVLWLVINNLELTCKKDYSIVESAPLFSHGNNNNNLALDSFKQLK